MLENFDIYYLEVLTQDYLAYVWAIQLILILILFIFNFKEIKNNFRKINLWTWTVLSFVLLLGFYLRLNFLRGCDSGDGLTFYYVFNAEEIIKSMKISDVHLPMGYSFLLAIVFLFLGASYQNLIFFNILVSTLTILLVFCSSYILFRREYAALISSLVFSLFPTHIFFTHLGSSNVTFTFFSTLTFLLFLISLNENRIKTYSLAFLLLAFLSAIRMEGYLFFGLFVFGLLLYKQKVDKRKIIVPTILLFVFLLSISYFLIWGNYLFGTVNVTDPQYEKFLKTFSLTYLKTNLDFHFSALSDSGNYPQVLILFIFISLISSLYKKNLEIAFPFLWICLFFMFYGVYWHSTFGNPYLYQLHILPPIAILVGYGIWSIIRLMKNFIKNQKFRDFSVKFFVFIFMFYVLSIFSKISVFTPTYDEFCVSKEIQKIFSKVDKNSCTIIEDSEGDQLRLYPYIKFLLPERKIALSLDECSTDDKLFYLRLYGKRFNFVFGKSNKTWDHLNYNSNLNLLLDKGDPSNTYIEVYEILKK